jgi:N6-L-threonylcarbamoyladenine synthase
MHIDNSTVVLGIESSCDETAAAIVMGGNDVLSSVVSSQIDIHAKFGGVVPEVASRAHLELMQPVINEAIQLAGIGAERVNAVATTIGPGLIGALLVGVSAGKAMAYGLDVPFIGVNHLEAHLYAALLEEPHLPFPSVVLLVSGGNTLLIHMTAPGEYSLLGATIDDAAGEAFDKIARFLDIGYPGGPAIDAAAQKGDPKSIEFPRAMLHDGLDFSFSGLKTAVSLLADRLRKENQLESEMQNVCASVQEAIVDALLTKIYLAIREHGCRSLAIVGGVAANSRLRERLDSEWRAQGLAGAPVFPQMKYCTDNAAMIAFGKMYPKSIMILMSTVLIEGARLCHPR